VTTISEQVSAQDAWYEYDPDRVLPPAVDLAAGDPHVAEEAMHDPGLPVPDNKTAIAMFTAHRVDDMLRELAHATERMEAARDTHYPQLRAYHAGHIRRHLEHVLKAAHELVTNLREHYPAEAAELEQVKHHIGLARALSPGTKAATTAHLTETTLHEATHGVRHAKEMQTPEPRDVWEFNADHAKKHLSGAMEHAEKLAAHFRDNYAEEAKWLQKLGEMPLAGEDGQEGGQHARYGKHKDTSMTGDQQQVADMAETISAQLEGEDHPKA
jgi:hypothetical protein